MAPMRSATLLASALLVLLLSGCGGREAPSREQSLAEANAGVMALPLAKTESERAQIQQGIQDYLVAANEGKELPPPKHTPADIAADPPTFAADGAKAKKDSSGWRLVGIISGAAFVVGVALRIGKDLPGVAGIAISLADVVWRQLAPNAAIDADRRAGAALQNAVQYGRAVTAIATAADPGAVELVKNASAAVQAHLGIKDQIDAILKASKQA